MTFFTRRAKTTSGILLSWSLLTVTLTIAFSESAVAQLPKTELRALAPAGGQAGTTTEVSLTSGLELADTTGLIFNHPGITATPQMTGEGAAAKPVSQKFVVTIAPEVPNGIYEVRATGFFGTSNPRAFSVSRLKELTEKEANNSRETATEVSLESVLNGVVGAAGDLDFYKFSGKAGQRVLAIGEAAQIDSRVNAVLELYNEKGRRIASARSNYREDPLLDFKLPTDGTYFLKVSDMQFRGGAEYGYRISLSTSPFIDFTMPSSLMAGTSSEVTLFGRNLPGGTPSEYQLDGQTLDSLKVTLTAPPNDGKLPSSRSWSSEQFDVEGFVYHLTTDSVQSNPICLHYSNTSTGLEQEPNDTLEQAQSITIPTEISGQFQNKGDSDYFVFEAKQGEVYFIEVFGSRNGSDADPMFALEQLTYDKEGKETAKRLTFQDDVKTNLLAKGFDTYSPDPNFYWTVPATGKYRLLVRDRYFDSRGKANLTYRLSIRPETPDFHLVTLPLKAKPAADATYETGVLALRKGANLALKVLSGRKDNYKGPIDIVVEGLPDGVSWEAKPIAAGTNSTEIILSTTKETKVASASIKVLGKAHIEYPDAVRNLDKMKVALKGTQEALAKQKTEQAAKQKTVDAANQKIQTAVEAAKQNPEDKKLQDQLLGTLKEFAAVNKILDQAKANVAAAESAVKSANDNVAQADEKRQSMARDLAKPARSGSITWNLTGTIPVNSRLAETLQLSVIDEQAPFQLTTNTPMVTLNQGGQLFLPLQLSHEAALANNVEVAVVGLDKNAKVDAPAATVAKDQKTGHLKLYVQPDAPVKSYALLLKTKNKHPYRKHLARLQALQADQKQQETVVKQATDSVNQSKAKVDSQTKQLAMVTEQKKVALTNAGTAQQKLTESQNALKLAQQIEAEYAALSKQLAALTASATESLDKTTKLAQKSTNPLSKALEETTAKTKAALQQAQQAEQAGQASLKTAKTATANLAKLVQDQTQAVQQAQAAINKADEAIKATDAAKKQAEQQKANADQNLKNAQAAKAELDKKVKAAEAVSKPKDIEIYPPSNLITLNIKAAPGKLAVNVPNKGTLKAGEELALKATFTRNKEFKGPVKLNLVLPPGKTGLSAAPVELAADKTEATLTLKAGKEIAAGEIDSVSIQAVADFNGTAKVDAPFKITIAK